MHKIIETVTPINKALVVTAFSDFKSLFTLYEAVNFDIASGIPLDTNTIKTINTENAT